MSESVRASKYVCVIGAGLSGLCTIKELKEEGHNVTCYESSDDFGGAFSKLGNASKMYESIKLTVSNYFMAFSSLPPMIGEKRKYWTGEEYYQYLHRYVETFNLSDNIIYNSKVLNVERVGSLYNVSLSNGETKKFDAVVICTGTNRIPKKPFFKNQDIFQGKVLHTSDYVSPAEFKGKKVICVGVGESGVDVVHDISKHTSQCTLLCRSVPSIVPRYNNELPGDAFTSKALNCLGVGGLNSFMKFKAFFYLIFSSYISEKDRLHYQWILKTDSYASKFLTKNDDFMSGVLNRQIEFFVSDIREYNENGLILQDGKHIEADIVLLNTGYGEDFSAVSSFIEVDNVRKLYKHMISPDIGETFALIGWARPSQGGVPLCSELQARYLAKLLSGALSLPDQNILAMLTDADEEYEEGIFWGSSDIKGLVNYHQFVESLASLIGCSPRWKLNYGLKMLYKMWFGSHLPYFYRLNGPGASPDSAITIIESLSTGSSITRNFFLSVLGIFHSMKRRLS